MNISFIDEPDLQFGNAKHIDIKFGIMNYGVLDFDREDAPRKINLGIVGTNETIEKFLQWVEERKSVVLAKESNKKNLFPLFPGFNTEQGFYSEIISNSTFHRTINQADITSLSIIPKKEERIKAAVDIYLSEIEYLIERHLPIDVIVCAFPINFLNLIDHAEDVGADEKDAITKYDLRRLLKAKTLKYNIPIQIILPSTYDDTVKRKVKINSLSDGALQDKATRAWNFFTALYYKAGGTPWRLIRNSNDFQSCYIGVSFYRSLDEETIQTSIAQVFNERGEGIIIRGANAKQSKEDKQIHLDREGAEQLLTNTLKKYKQEHKTMPARVVIHKSSDYDQNEIDGFIAAIRNEGIELFDFISLAPSITRLHRVGKYPPLRGTFLELDEEQKILYTKGSVDFYQTYPGLYIPKTLKIKIATTEQTTRFLAAEILSLTKMNWNNTQFDNSSPITIKAARQVGEILKYVEDDEHVQPSYSFYM